MVLTVRTFASTHDDLAEVQYLHARPEHMFDRCGYQFDKDLIGFWDSKSGMLRKWTA